MASKEITATGFISVSKDITGGYSLVEFAPRLIPVFASSGARAVGLGMLFLRAVLGGCKRTDALDAWHELHLHVLSRSFPGRLFPPQRT